MTTRNLVTLLFALALLVATVPAQGQSRRALRMQALAPSTSVGPSIAEYAIDHEKDGWKLSVRNQFKGVEITVDSSAGGRAAIELSTHRGRGFAFSIATGYKPVAVRVLDNSTFKVFYARNGDRKEYCEIWSYMYTQRGGGSYHLNWVPVSWCGVPDPARK
jgi:hypothetical protein